MPFGRILTPFSAGHLRQSRQHLGRMAVWMTTGLATLWFLRKRRRAVIVLHSPDDATMLELGIRHHEIEAAVQDSHFFDLEPPHHRPGYR